MISSEKSKLNKCSNANASHMINSVYGRFSQDLNTMRTVVEPDLCAVNKIEAGAEPDQSRTFTGVEQELRSSYSKS